MRTNAVTTELRYYPSVLEDFEEFAQRKLSPEAEKALADSWRKANPQTEADYLEFYKNCNYIEELVSWHSRKKLHPKTVLAKKIIRIVSSLPNIRTILDLGCGIGTDLMELKALGYEVEGLEANLGNIEFLNFRAKKHGLEIPVRQGYEDAIESGKAYDLIMFIDVIEHFKDPFLALETITRSNPRYLLFTQSFGVHEEEAGGQPQHSDFSKAAIAKKLTSLCYEKVKVREAFPPQLWVRFV